MHDGAKATLKGARMRRRGRIGALVAIGILVIAGGWSPMPVPWMTEAAMRTAFIGRTLDGHYSDGLTWTETYMENGRLDYREQVRRAAGYWFFKGGDVFCTFYDPPSRPTMNGGCWKAIQSSSNCYEFYLAGLSAVEPEDKSRDPLTRWNARGWRSGEVSTCAEKPTV
jgi:hypothetical protein